MRRRQISLSRALPRWRKQFRFATIIISPLWKQLPVLSTTPVQCIFNKVTTSEDSVLWTGLFVRQGLRLLVSITTFVRDFFTIGAGGCRPPGYRRLSLRIWPLGRRGAFF